MNNPFNRFDFEEENKKAKKLPAWIWIIGVFGLVVAVLTGYFYGVELTSTYKSIVVQDTNGDDTSLNTIGFSECIGVFDNEFGYNRFDSDSSFALKYNSTVKYNNAKGMYPNDFSDVASVSYTVDFGKFNFYDITYAKRSEKETVFTFSSELKKGNLEACIFRIDDDFKVKAKEFGASVIEDGYVHEEARFSANGTHSVTLPGGSIYVLVVGCESADGSYTFKAE